MHMRSKDWNKSDLFLLVYLTGQRTTNGCLLPWLLHIKKFHPVYRRVAAITDESTAHQSYLQTLKMPENTTERVSHLRGQLSKFINLGLCVSGIVFIIIGVFRSTLLLYVGCAVRMFSSLILHCLFRPFTALKILTKPSKLILKEP